MSLYLSNRPVFFFKYQPHIIIPTASAAEKKSSSASSSTVHHPHAAPIELLRFESFDQMISDPDLCSTRFPKIAEKYFSQRLFEQKVKNPSTAEFFFNCEATHKGITNFDDQTNENLNSSLLEAVAAAAVLPLPSSSSMLGEGRFLFENVRQVVELGAGTGRLSRVIAKLYAQEFYRSNNNTEPFDFLFCEPNEKLRASCIENVRKSFAEAAAETKSRDTRSGIIFNEKRRSFCGEVRIEEHDVNRFISTFPSPKQHENQLLIMSGVAQYMSDKTLTELLSLFPKILLQEDVSSVVSAAEFMDEKIFAIFHERDGSFVRSEHYWEEEIFRGRFWMEEMGQKQVVSFNILGKSEHFVHGCMTKTWALERSSI